MTTTPPTSYAADSQPLPPSAELTNSHHGPFISHYFRKNSSYEDGLPRFFMNPWPSYRQPSLGDAYRAYSLGAAIAHPAPRKLRLSRSSLHLSANEGQDAYKCDDGEDAPRLTNESWLPANTYVRPVFAEMFEDDDAEDWREPPVRVVTPEWGGVEGEGNGDKETVTWLGHAGVLVQVPWARGERQGMCGVLYDPIFSYRCSPSQYVGPARHVDPPCSVSLLPDIHVCCISHDHYYYTIMDLWKYHQRTIHFLVPLALKPWFTSSGIPEDRITELDWWHETLLSFPSAASSPTSSTFPGGVSGAATSSGAGTGTGAGTDTKAPGDISPESTDLVLKFAFTPAQHRSGRGLLDHMKTLWGSWCFGVVDKQDWARRGERGMLGWKGFKVFFGGDTGYRYATAPDEDDSAICPAFSEIAQHYSPFSLALLPLNTGSSLPFLRTILSLSLDQYTLTSAQHCSPSDSLEIHRILQAERSLGMHWGTFCDADESRGTRVEFGRARRERGVGRRWVGEGEEEQGEEEGGRGRFVVADIGETLVFP